MLSGALIKIADDLDIEKLDGIKWERKEGSHSLKSVLQFQGPRLTTPDITANAALAIHERPGRQAMIDESEEGKYSISYIDTVDTIWANVYIARGFVIVDGILNRPFVREIINKGLKPTYGAHNVSLNTAKMAADHAGQWIRSFSDRRGRVDRGTVFGEEVEQDIVFGPELGRSKSRVVGWTTTFFGSPVKVRVTPGGSVSVWAWPPTELFIRFIQKIILPYMIAL